MKDGTIAWMIAAVAVLPAAAQDLRYPRDRDPRPNVIVIFADDLGYGDLSCFGQKQWSTPHLDRMAAEGARFTSFYTTCPFCAPSRAALLTGRYQFRSGVTGNPAPDGGNNDTHLPPDEITIAESLRDAGYKTLMVGKWHLGHRRPWYPIEQGFDEYLGILYSNDMRPVELIHNDRVVEYPVVQATLTKRYTQKAVDFIEANRHWAFFMYLPHAMPHKPLAASETFYTPDTPEDLYADVIRELDWGVGRVLEKLRELKLDRRTLVIFTSDNGPWFGGSTGGLRGMKGASWEGGYRVPMIAWMPGAIPAGLETDEMAAVIDVMPTVLARCGVALPQPPGDGVIDGRDIWPLMTSRGARSPHEALYCMAGARLATVRSGKWKLHVEPPSDARADWTDDWVDPRLPDGVTLLAQFEQAMPSQYPGTKAGVAARPMMLFDLEADRAETSDVADENPQVVERLRKLYDQVNDQVIAARPLSPADRAVKGKARGKN